MPKADVALNQHLRTAIEMMEADIAHDIKIKHLASTIGISRSHLTSLFKAAFGLPPHRWLLRKRLETARTLLTDEAGSITGIAFSCGFNSSQHFATAFRARFGVSPSAYRRNRDRAAAVKAA